MNQEFFARTIDKLITPLRMDKVYILEVIQVNPTVSQGALLERERDRVTADIVDGTTKDVILPNLSELHNSWICTSELYDESDPPGSIFVSINLF